MTTQVGRCVAAQLQHVYATPQVEWGAVAQKLWQAIKSLTTLYKLCLRSTQTPPCEKLTTSLSQGEYECQMDWHIEQLHLKITLPLSKNLVKSNAEGVQASCGSVQ